MNHDPATSALNPREAFAESVGAPETASDRKMAPKTATRMAPPSERAKLRTPVAVPI